jgi:hypothetical protein
MPSTSKRAATIVRWECPKRTIRHNAVDRLLKVEGAELVVHPLRVGCRPRWRFSQMPTLDPNMCAPFSGPDFSAHALGEAQPRLLLENFVALREASPEHKNFCSPNFVENNDAVGHSPLQPYILICVVE